MTHTKQKQTLRLILPQWQGGNNPVYHFGSQLLAWLAPDNGQETVEISVEEPKAPHEDLVDGIVAKQQLLKQSKNTMDVLKEREPDRVVVLGGDCSVELAPFSYLAERYDDDMAILWIDAHPDITGNVPELPFHGVGFYCRRRGRRLRRTRSGESEVFPCRICWYQ